MANTEFQFEEFEDDANVMGTSPRETTINIDAHISKPQKQNWVTGRALPEEETDPLNTDDNTELLSGKRKSAPFWTLEYYQAFFSVETHQVKARIVGSVLPWPGKNFVCLHIRNKPDLYGPFWICATLVFAIGISGNMSNFFMTQGQAQHEYVPDFRKVTMAATAIYSYAWLVPLTLWGFLTWRNSRVKNMVTYSFLEIVCVYGYSVSIYIPAVVLWIIPSELVRWCSIAVALCLSGSVLVLTFWPAVRNDRPRIAIAVTSMIIALHVLLAVGCKAYFFSTYNPPTVVPAKVSTTLLITKGH